jgi:hypothetical protein
MDRVSGGSRFAETTTGQVGCSWQVQLKQNPPCPTFKARRYRDIRITDFNMYAASYID